MTRKVSRAFFSVNMIAWLAVVLVAVSSAEGNFLVNGDFEDTEGWGEVGSEDYPAAWADVSHPDSRVNAAAQLGPPGVIGGDTSAYLPAAAGTTPPLLEISQDLDPVQEWTFQMDFATEDPGGASDRSLHMALYHTVIAEDGENGIIARVIDLDEDGDGDFQVYGIGVGYQTVLPDAVVFDDDVQNEPLVHQLEFVGHYEDASPTYDVTLTDSDANVHTITGLNYWYGSQAPVDGDGIVDVMFFNSWSAGDYLVDNVSLTGIQVVNLPGDLNGDGFVGGDDLDIVRSFWGQDVTPGDLLSGDPSGDGFVGGDDLDIVRGNWGEGTPPAAGAVPEPVALVFFATGMLALMACGRRRRDM